MTITTTPTLPRATQPAPTSPRPTRRLLWAALAFALGGIFGAGVTLAVDNDPSGRGDAGDVISDAAPGPVARSTASPFASADAMDRAAHHRREAVCARLGTSADAAERCLGAGG